MQELLTMLWISQGSYVMNKLLFVQALMMMLLNLNAAINSIFSGSVFLNDPHNWCWSSSSRVSILIIIFRNRKRNLSKFGFAWQNSWRSMHAYFVAYSYFHVQISFSQNVRFYRGSTLSHALLLTINCLWCSVCSPSVEICLLSIVYFIEKQ